MRFAVGQAFESAVSGSQAVLGTSASLIVANSNGFFGRSFFMKESGFRLV